MQDRPARWLGALTTAIVVALCGGQSAGADVVTFGSNLQMPANAAPLVCEKGVLNQYLGQFLIGPSGGSCMWSSVVIGSPAESLTAPTSGTVTAVRVRTGASTGPMQVNIVRFLFRQTGNPGAPELACCFVEEYGPVFTPAANTITTVPTNLPVKVELTPPPSDITTIAATDQLALSSLDPSVQVPLFATKNGENDLSVLSYAWYPAPTVSGVPAPSPNPIPGFADLSGFKVLMNADLSTGIPAPAGGELPIGRESVPGAAPTVTLPKSTIPVRRGTVAVPIECGVLDCSGRIDLQSSPAGKLASVAKRKAATVRTFGSARFSLKAGKGSNVKVKLNAAGRRLVGTHGRAKVWANVHLANGGILSSKRLTLKR